MADVYEQNLAQKSSLTTSDYIRVVGSDNVSYKQGMQSVSDNIIKLASKTGSGDADNLTTAGMYWCNGANVANLPSTSHYYRVRVEVYSGAVNQYANANGTRNIYFRTLANNAWTSWTLLPTRAEIDAVSTRTDITSSVTVNSKLTVNEFHVYKTGKVVSVLGAFTATDSIPNGEALISDLPTSGIGGNDICPMLTPVRASYWSTTPSKYHFQSLRNTEIINGTTTLASGDVIQINLTYLAQ